MATSPIQARVPIAEEAYIPPVYYNNIIIIAIITDIHAKDKKGRSAVYYAAHSGKNKMAKWLLEKNVSIEDRIESFTPSRRQNVSLPAPDCWKRTPLHEAVKNNHAEVVKLLIARSSHSECLQILIDNGGNLLAKTDKRHTAIDFILEMPKPVSFLNNIRSSRAYYTQRLYFGVYLKPETENRILDVRDATFQRKRLKSSSQKNVFSSLHACLLLKILVNTAVLAPEKELQMEVVVSLIRATTNMKETILQHPLVEVYLWGKWSKLKIYFYIFHVLLVLSLSVLSRNQVAFDSTVLRACSSSTDLGGDLYYLKLETWLSISIVGISLAVSIGTYCHLSASSLTSIFEGNELHDNYRQYPPQWIFHSVSVAILLASVQTMVLIGRLPQWGYYTLVSFTEGTFLWSVLNVINRQRGRLIFRNQSVLFSLVRIGAPGTTTQISPIENQIRLKTANTDPTLQVPPDNTHCTLTSLQKIIKNLPNNKAPGPDGITAEKIKNLPKKPLIQLYYIYKACLRTAYFPTSWKIAKIIPVPKPGKQRDDITSYRPISLFDLFGKILEKIIQQQIQRHGQAFRHTPTTTSHRTHHNGKKQKTYDPTSSTGPQQSIRLSLTTHYNNVHLRFFTSFQLFPVFLCLIVGFALSFAVLFHGNDQFSNFWNSVVKTVVMMMGEYDYGDLFSENNGSSFLPVTSRIVFLIFVLASMVLVNLMIGIAVNDIQSLKKKGHILQLEKQAEFVNHLERLASYRIFDLACWQWFLAKLRKSRQCFPTKIDSRRFGFL
ncbi:uncharacterized protein LOC122530879 [Frieseomelitta varia]|uniref:uncharacterized protein LOC122530879 n=1 Tax=Frieseomelitta varia TaxID=561572 RepID=UPI001CB6A307|nr:uncharacterized protein LOC122530879 [Frieseomelitta varia]